jgi:hypothetical protein
VQDERRTESEIRAEIAAEREQLTTALADLRNGFDERRKLAAALGGMVATGLAVAAAAGRPRRSEASGLALSARTRSCRRPRGCRPARGSLDSRRHSLGQRRLALPGTDTRRDRRPRPVGGYGPSLRLRSADSR